MKPIQTVVLIVALSALPLGIARAADAPATKPATSAAIDAEEALDESLKGFGYLSGLARGCSVPADRGKLEREALDLAAIIARLFGIDRAFLYSSSFGYGTSMQIAANECAEVLRQYDARVAKFRAQRGVTP